MLLVHSGRTPKARSLAAQLHSKLYSLASSFKPAYFPALRKTSQMLMGLIKYLGAKRISSRCKAPAMRSVKWACCRQCGQLT